MENLEIISWIACIITVISFLLNIIQYFRHKVIDNKYQDFTNNITVFLVGIRNALSKTILEIEKSTPPQTADKAIFSLKGSVKAEIENINSWIDELNKLRSRTDEYGYHMPKSKPHEEAGSL